MSSVIYHNPKCSTSRFVLEILELAGEQPKIVLYLKDGWTLDALKGLLAESGLAARDILRTRNTSAKELGLMDETVTEAKILAAMVADPVLVERPIIKTSRGVALCRPKMRVFDMLSDQSARVLTTPKGEEFQIPVT